MYIGGKWLGIEPIKDSDGKEIKPGEVIAEMTEREAIARKGFEPAYDEPERKSYKKSRKEGGE